MRFNAKRIAAAALAAVTTMSLVPAQAVLGAEQTVRGTDPMVTVDKNERVGEVSPLLYGACMEDVNHELYGGIWSQMVFGESFAEPAQAKIDGFTAYGGSWSVGKDGDTPCIEAGQHNGVGPKMMIADTECETGVVSADILLNGAGPAGFTIKTTDPKVGADNFNGYEVGIAGGRLHLGAHRYNYTDLGDYPCNVTEGTYANLKVVMQKDSFKVYVNGDMIKEYTDPNPLEKGSIGLRAWDCSAKFKNIKFGATEEDMRDIEIPVSLNVKQVSGMWRAVERGDAQGSLLIDKENQFKDTQSQVVEFLSGTGAIGVNNMSLNRKGMNFEADKPYEGYLYMRAPQNTDVYVVLESAEGDKKYGEAKIAVSGNEWKKYAFDVTSNAKDAAGRMTVELRAPGKVALGYAFLQPGEWGRYKGLPVRKDVGEALERENLSVMRFGGCMANANDYKWKSMLGAPENRPIYKGWWYDYSSLGFGIAEFLDLCEALNIPAIPDFNRNETPQDMADFIDFATGTDENNEWVKQRIAMGHPAPYKLPYLQFGNEERVDDNYANQFIPAAEAIWAKTKDITLIVGDFAYHEKITDPYNFRGTDSGITTLAPHKRMLEAAKKYDCAVWFDIHFFTEQRGQSKPFFTAAESLYEQLHAIVPGTKAKLPIFELNANTHDVQRALENAYAVNRAERLSDIFPIVCSANALQVNDHNDNMWNQGLVFMDNDSAWLQPPAYVMQMANDAYMKNAISVKPDRNISYVDFSAAISDDENTVTVKIVNQLTSSKTFDLNFKEFTGSKNKVKYTTLAGKSNGQTNTQDHDAVVPEVTQVDDAVQKNILNVTVKPLSYTVITVTKESEPEPEDPEPEPDPDKKPDTNPDPDKKPDPQPTVKNNTVENVNGKIYFYNDKGAVVKNNVYIYGGKMYAADKNGARIVVSKNTLKTVGKKSYVIGKNGVIVCASKKYKLVSAGKKAYVVDKNGAVVKSKKNYKIVTVSAKKIYAVDRKGVVAKAKKGYKRVKAGKKYYAVGKNGKAVLKKTVKINGKRYKANKSGVLKKA